MEENKEEKKIIINERVDSDLQEFEKILGAILPIKGNTELVNNILYSPLSDETKEKVIHELLEDSKKRITVSPVEGE